jgi:hypothetical protein
VATHFLDIDYSDQYEFILVGLSCRQKDYRLAWSLNREMNWSLERVDDLEIPHKTGSSFHARFVFHHSEDMVIYSLLANRSDEKFILPEWSQFDFFLKIEEGAFEVNDTFYRRLRKSPFVLAAYEIREETVRSRNNLIFMQ